MTCALREKQKLAEAGYENVGVAFNASPELLVHSDFFDRLGWEADNANIDHAQITIEVLETTDFGNLAEGSPQASSIRQSCDAGFQIHLDDFGVGFAGLQNHRAQRLSAGAVAREPGKALCPCPAPITIHDDGNMPG